MFFSACASTNNQRSFKRAATLSAAVVAPHGVDAGRHSVRATAGAAPSGRTGCPAQSSHPGRAAPWQSTKATGTATISGNNRALSVLVGERGIVRRRSALASSGLRSRIPMRWGRHIGLAGGLAGGGASGAGLAVTASQLSHAFSVTFFRPALYGLRCSISLFSKPKKRFW